MTHAAMYLWFGFDIIRVFRQLAGDAMDFNVQAQRPYSIWVWENLREFLFGAGVAQVALFPAALMAGLWRAGSWKERLTEPVTVVSVGVLTVLLAIDLIGVNRGEVIRLWIFLACFFQIPAAYVCARLEEPGRPRTCADADHPPVCLRHLDDRIHRAGLRGRSRRCCDAG